MIHAAAASDGILFESPPAGRGFAGVVDPRFGTRRLVDELARERGDPGEVAEEIQDRPFANEQVPCRSGNFGDNVSGRNLVAIGRHRLDVDRRVHFVDHDRQCPQPGDDAWPTNNNRRPALLVRGDHGERRPIMKAIEILAHGEADDLAEVVLDGAVPIVLGEVGRHRVIERRGAIGPLNRPLGHELGAEWQAASCASNSSVCEAHKKLYCVALEDN